MNTYKAFYKGKSIEVQATTSYEAQRIAALQFKAKRQFEVSVILLYSAKSGEIVHNPAILN